MYWVSRLLLGRWSKSDLDIPWTGNASNLGDSHFHEMLINIQDFCISLHKVVRQTVTSNVLLALSFLYLITNMQQLRRFLPKSFEEALREVYFNFVLRLAILRLTFLAEGETLDRGTLTVLRRLWGNVKWSAELEYLEELCSLSARTNGPILECGSGLTTVLLALLARKRGITVWSLEHNPKWYDRVKRVLNKHQIENVNLCLAPLRSYGDFMWYNPPMEQMPRDFRLVLCDGPPGTTLGGRYGLISVMDEHIASECIILLDDAGREDEAKILKRWAEEANVQFRLAGTDRTFASVTFC